MNCAFGCVFVLPGILFCGCLGLGYAWMVLFLCCSCFVVFLWARVLSSPVTGAMARCLRRFSVLRLWFGGVVFFLFWWFVGLGWVVFVWFAGRRGPLFVVN